MVKVIIGAVAAAIVMFVIGFILYATPLAKLGTASLDNAQAAAVQNALAQNLRETGTYHVPGVDTPEQTNMYSSGPIATVHYNTNGFGAVETGSLVAGLVLYFVVALLIGAALIGIDRRVPDFGSRARVVVIFSVAASAFMHLSGPIMFHHGWGHFIYRFIADALMLSGGGLVIARWFLPRGVSASADERPAAASE